MIDKEKFDETFGMFDNHMIVEIIDAFLNQYPDLSGLLEKSIIENNLVRVKDYSHKLKGSIVVFHERISGYDAQIIENEARFRLLEIIDEFAGFLPESELKIRRENDMEFVLLLLKNQSIVDYFSRVAVSFPEDRIERLKEMERSLSLKLPQMFETLQASGKKFVMELQAIKKSLSA